MGNFQIYQAKPQQRLHVDLLHYRRIFGRIEGRPIGRCGSKQDNVLQDVCTRFLPKTTTQIPRQGNKQMPQTKRNNIKTTLHEGGNKKDEKGGKRRKKER